MFLRCAELGEHSHQCAGAHLGELGMLVPLSKGDAFFLKKISYLEKNLRGIGDTSIQSTEGTKK